MFNLFKKSKTKIYKFDLLVSVYIFCIVAAELMGAKVFPLLTIGTYTLNASVAIFLIPILFTINDMIIEVYGKERARSVVRSGLFIIFLILIATFVFTLLPPADRFLESESAYDEIFIKSMRISAASLVAFAFAEFLDIAIFAHIREKLGKSKLWLRNNVSNIIAQLFDTIIFFFLAFYAFDKGVAENVQFLISLTIPYWLLKSFMSIIETPFLYVGIKWLKDEK